MSEFIWFFELSLRFVGFAALLVLPGAWIAFSPITAPRSGWMCLALAHVLSWPLAIAGYFLFRLVGLNHEVTCSAVLIISLPAVWLIFRSGRHFEFGRPKVVFALAFALLLPSLALALVLIAGDTTPFWSHNLMHSNTISAIRENPFQPDNRYLAGEPITYPWAPHVYYSQLATVLGVPSSSIIYVTGPSLLLALSSIAMLLVKEVGGGLIAQLASPVACAFSVNPIGTLSRWVMFGQSPTGSEPHISWYYRLGDVRYDLTAIKFFFFSVNAPGLVLLLALATILSAEVRESTWKSSVLAMFVSFALVVIYPLHLPVAILLASAGLLPAFLSARHKKVMGALRTWAAVFFAAALAYWTVSLQTSARREGLGLEIVFPPFHVFSTATALSIPMVALFAISVQYLGQRKPSRSQLSKSGLLPLAAAGVATASLATLLSIPNIANEYKFVLAASVLLSPFVALMVEALWNWQVPFGKILVGALACLAAAAFVATAGRLFHRETQAVLPEMYLDRAIWKLKDDNPYSHAIEVLRDRTPNDTIILLAVEPNWDIPLFAQRSIFSRLTNNPHTGVMMEPDYMIADVLGYGRDVTEERKDILAKLLGDNPTETRAAALADVLAIGRSVAVLSHSSDPTGVIDWMTVEGTGTSVTEGGEYTVWLISQESGA